MSPSAKALVVSCLAGLPCAAGAAGTTLTQVLANSGITAGGHLSASYTDGFNHGQALAYRAFDTDSNSFEFNQAVLRVARKTRAGVGGRITLLAGSDAKLINGAYGNRSSADFALEQAYLDYTHGDFSVLGGRFVTLAGAEVIDAAHDANISRSLLFQLAEPLVHTGVRTRYTLGKATFHLGVNNGIYTGNASDTNRQKTLEAGVALAPSSALSLALCDYYSHEGGAGLNYLDFVGSVQLTPKLQFVLNGDWFSQHPTSRGAAHVYGVAAYLNYAWSGQWSTSLRGEYLHTRNIALNAPADGKATLGEVTATVAYSPLAQLRLLAEVRYDFGDKVYPDPAAPNFRDTQGNVAIAAIYSF